MDKWKIIVIVALLGTLGGYGYYQQNAATAPQNPDPATQPTPRPANEKLLKFQGQTPPAWDIAKQNWVNTPAPISLSSLRGNVSLVEFWRIGCSHCQEAAPFLDALYKKYQPKGLKMVAIHSPGNLADPQNPELNWNTVQQRIKEWGISYPVAYDEGGKLFKEAYGGDTYPTMLILNRKGEVQQVLSGHTKEKEKQLVAALDQALAAK